jgi:hypothetical protein
VKGGTLLFKKDSLGNKEKPVLGFLLSANYTNQLDSRPLANGGGYRIKKEVRDEILANPLIPQPDGKVPLHTLRAKIDYTHQRAETIYGVIGIKVWLFSGEQ